MLPSQAGKQGGIALLSILLILTLMTLMLAEFTFEFRNQLRRTTARQNLEQARWYALSAEELAINGLAQTFEDGSDGKKDVIHLGQYWATSGLVFPVENGQIAGAVRDAQGCFNLNALAKQDQADGQLPGELKVFAHLLSLLEVDDYHAEAIARATRDWVSDEEPETGAVTYGDDYYLARPVPHLAGRTQMRDVSEWRAVAGVSSAIARHVMPYLCAIPESELAINVNTIPEDQPELLAALFYGGAQGNLPVDQALKVLEGRPSDGWSTMDSFLTQPLLANYNSTDAKKYMIINSHYFELQAEAGFSDSVTGLRSLLRREGDDKLSVIRRKLGGSS